MSGTEHRFSETERAAVYRAIAERRDMRPFRPDPADPAALHRLLQAAHHAPSGGLVQPWRFLRIADRPLQELAYHNTWGNTVAPGVLGNRSRRCPTSCIHAVVPPATLARPCASEAPA
jgi:5,6-dimethylbenzimidazole synthase